MVLGQLAGGEWTKGWEGTQLYSAVWPQLTKTISHTVWHHAQYIKPRMKKRKSSMGIWSYDICLLKQLLHAMKPCFLRDNWTSSCWSFICTHSFHFTYRTVFVSTHKFCHFYPSNSLLTPLQRMRNWLAGSAPCQDKPTTTVQTLLLSNFVAIKCQIFLFSPFKQMKSVV